MWDSTRLCATPAGMVLYDVGSKHPAPPPFCLQLHDAWSSKALQTGISLRPHAPSFCSQEGKLWREQQTSLCSA